MTGDEYKAIREAAKLSQQALADRVGLDIKTITRIEVSDEVRQTNAMAIKYACVCCWQGCGGAVTDHHKLRNGEYNRYCDKCLEVGRKRVRRRH